MTPERCVSVVIVTYESAAFVGACLDSLWSTAGEWLTDCIVVDNASDDRTVETIRSRYPDVQLFENRENVGFGSAVNIGVRHAQGELILILNPDTFVMHGTIAELVWFMRFREKACACGPKVINNSGVFDESSRRGFPTPWNALGYLFKLDRLFPRNRVLGGYRRRGLSPDIEAMTECLSGACMLVRKTCFEAISGFDEDYFLFGEDIDLCWRLIHQGNEIWYVPAATVIHTKGASMKRVPRTARREFYRAMHLFIRKRLAQTYPRPLILAARSGVAIAALLSRRFSNSKHHDDDAANVHLRKGD